MWLKNGKETRKGVVHDMGTMWQGFLADRPAVLPSAWPKGIWECTRFEVYDAEKYPAEGCSCKDFNQRDYGELEPGQHSRYCTFNPVRVRS